MPPLTGLLTIFHSSTVLSMITAPTLPSNLCPLTVCMAAGVPVVGVDSKTMVLVPVTSESLMSCKNGGNAVFIRLGGINSGCGVGSSGAQIGVAVGVVGMVGIRLLGSVPHLLRTCWASNTYWPGVVGAWTRMSARLPAASVSFGFWLLP